MANLEDLERWEPTPAWIHETTGNNFRAWHATVEDFTAAAGKVHDHSADGSDMMMSINGVAAMLYGYAIESALKGLLARKNVKLIEKRRLVEFPGSRTHELKPLAEHVSKTVDLGLTKDELNVLDRLSNFVIFAGRYPVSTRPEGMEPAKGLGVDEQAARFFSTADFNVATTLLNRLTTALNPFLPENRKT
jgi:hypothetical protein